MPDKGRGEVIPRDHDIEVDLVEHDRCTKLNRSGRAFCGRPAVGYQEGGPRCEGHLKEGESVEYLEGPDESNAACKARPLGEYGENQLRRWLQWVPC